MMATEQPQKLKERNLHDLLEGLTAAHKKDIHDYSGGHLNEANLAKSSVHGGYRSWKSAKKPAVKSQLPRPVRESAHETQMKNTFANFSMGTSTAMSTKPPFKRLGTKGPVRVPRKESAGTYSKMDDGVLVEELGEIMLANSRYSKPKAWVDEDLKDDDNYDLSSVSQALIKDQNLAKLKHTFVPGHLNGITKKDQFNSMKNFEHEVIRKHDAMEQNVLSGVKAVEHLETKLQQDLEQLQFHGYGPNFHRLQLYSDTFDDLIRHSATFGFILKTVKKEYDDYVASLLDNQGSKHKVLYEQVESMSQRQGANPRILAKEKANVSRLEQHTHSMIAENERLRRELEDELELASQPEPEVLELSKTSYGHDAAPELAEQIEELHATILEKLDVIHSLRDTLRRDFVPSTVVTHLEQCIKETEVELQKLQSQKEYFERSTSDLESELMQLIEQADTTERDSRRMWRKINAVKKMGAGNAQTADDEEEDDEVKWNWYIS